MSRWKWLFWKSIILTRLLWNFRNKNTKTGQRNVYFTVFIHTQPPLLLSLCKCHFTAENRVSWDVFLNLCIIMSRYKPKNITNVSKNTWNHFFFPFRTKNLSIMNFSMFMFITIFNLKHIPEKKLPKNFHIKFWTSRFYT